MNLRLGKLAPDHSRLSVPFGNFVSVPPTAPLADLAPDLVYPMDGNDRVGCCVVAGYDHFNQVVTSCLLGKGFNFTQEDIWNFYRTQNPGFDPNGSSETNGPGSSHDNGMSVQSFLEYLQKTGRILGFAKIDYTNEEELKAATYIGLGIITGVVLDKEQMTQFQSGLWDYVPDGTPEGGHCIPLVGYVGNPDYHTCVTWGKLVNCTHPFIGKQMDEAWFVLTQAHVDHPNFRNHFDLAGFSAAVSAITNGTVNIPVPHHMPTVTIKRTSDNGVEILGTLTTGTFTCKTLERPWLGNQHNISCIPLGQYNCVLSHLSTMNISAYELQDVNGRSGIFIHPANLVSQLEGCIAIGADYSDINGDKQLDVINSRATFQSFMDLMGGKPFTLIVS